MRLFEHLCSASLSFLADSKKEKGRSDFASALGQCVARYDLIRLLCLAHTAFNAG
jgi:hypothetical protein